MERIFLAVGVALILLMFLSLYRVIAGPSILDRIVGGNVVGTKTVVVLLLIGVLYNNVGMFVDISIAYALLNFIATLGATKYFLRRKTIHLEDSQ
ncbi:MAG: monovalent cation/H+ antiporter complex subunit F [Trichloromonas sp.]|jgi:multicomponent Na+:H+ antiporter subunit F|nr:monovalent cation/H+ antiporter complex subunit F [Trichloromonas sp.]